jgi:hypothetical protein
LGGVRIGRMKRSGTLRDNDFELEEAIMGDDLENTERGVSRRSVTKAMAWAVPVVAVAATVPTVAASVCDPVFSYGPLSCKCPGQGQNVKQYYMRICVSNVAGCVNPTPGTPTTLYVWSIRNNSAVGGVLTPASGFPIAIPITDGAGCAGSVERYDWVPAGSGSSAGKLAFRYNFSPVPGQPTTLSDFYAAPPNCPDTLAACNA